MGIQYIYMRTNEEEIYFVYANKHKEKKANTDNDFLVLFFLAFLKFSYLSVGNLIKKRKIKKKRNYSTDIFKIWMISSWHLI